MEKKVKVDKTHIIVFFIFVLHASPGMEIDVYVDQDFRQTEVK